MFETNNKLAACGPYVSCEKHPHIQAFMVVLNKQGFNILSKTWRCKSDDETRIEWIERTEIVIKINIIYTNILFINKIFF
jgi:hypothetical protein